VPGELDNLHSGSARLSKEGREYRRRVALQLVGWGRPPIETPVAVAFDAYPPDRRRRDSDNLIKAPLDCLVHAGLLLDDHLVRRVSLELHEADPPGRLDVAVSAWKAVKA
jgi:crossover junction endodeoxyribonuclease RusA